MVKVTVIDVDLGETIDNIINDDVKKLTEKNQAEIDKALAEQKAKLELRKEKAEHTQKIKQVNDKIAVVCEQAYQVMLANEKQNLTTAISALLKITDPIIVSPTSLVMRLKSHLKEIHGNEYVLKKCQRNGETHYQLIKYNISDDQA